MSNDLRGGSAVQSILDHLESEFHGQTLAERPVAARPVLEQAAVPRTRAETHEPLNDTGAPARSPWQRAESSGAGDDRGAGSNGTGPSGFRLRPVSSRTGRILVVEDDQVMANLVVRLLDQAGFSAFSTSFGEEAISLVESYRYDVALLDLTLPDMSGHQVLQAFRQLRPDMPIIILSGAAGLETKLEGFREGADDYVTKPFQAEELVARIQAVMRRVRTAAPTELAIGPLTIDLAGHRALVADRVVPLTGKEYACLEFLVIRRGSTVTKEMFLAHLYGGRNEPEMKIIDVFICKLRRKLKEAGAPNVIETVWGRGYTIPG